MSHAASDVMMIEALVERDRSYVPLDQLVSVLLEATAYLTHILSY
jgi:hypothetical protein